MPRGSDPAPPVTETPAGLRKMAADARRLAPSTLDQQAIQRLTEFAEEVEARAAAERRRNLSAICGALLRQH